MRNVKVQLAYNHQSVSNDIAKYLLSIEYTDQSSGKSDYLQISLEDREKLWENDWVPEKGDVIQATLLATGYNEENKTEELRCGFFEVDELELSGPPNSVSIKAVSAAVSSALRGEQNTKAWEQIRLKTIAQGMAEKAEVSLNYLAAYNPFYKRRDQTDQSDLAFLQDMCDQAGLSLKVTNDTLVIFDEEEFEQKDAVATIIRGKSPILRYSFASKSRDIYRACEIKYRDPASGQTFEYIYEPPNAPDTGQIYRIKERVEDAEEGKILARKRLREKNLKENMARLTVVGNPVLVAGVTVEIVGFGKFDGKYYITQARHRYSTSGYTTDIEMHKTMVSYYVNAVKTVVVDRRRKYTRKGRKKKKK